MPGIRPVAWNRNDSQLCRAFQMTVGEKTTSAIRQATYGCGRFNHGRWSGLSARKMRTPIGKKMAGYFDSIASPRNAPAAYHHEGRPPEKAWARAQSAAIQNRNNGQSGSTRDPIEKIMGTIPR